jgi:hypothetical protein
MLSGLWQLEDFTSCEVSIGSVDGQSDSEGRIATIVIAATILALSLR